MLHQILQPLPPQIISDASEHSYGSNIEVYLSEMPDWESSDLAIIGVPDGRFGKNNQESSYAPDKVRKAFYGLTVQNARTKICDLGNIPMGKSFADTEIALYEVLKELYAANVTPLVIGGSFQLGYEMYRALAEFRKNIECSVISPYINLDEDQILGKICLHEPNHLFNLNLLGYQSHYAKPDHAHTLEKMFFTTRRLGLIKSQLGETEPVLRNSDMLLFDIGVLKQADAPGNYYNNPSGLTAEEACQLAWFAGIGEKTNAFGLFEINPELDYRHTTSKLGAQLLWYFVEGYYARNGDHPDFHKEFIRYRCALNARQPDIVFYKSKRTDRWWMEIPSGNGPASSATRILIPCAYSDYQMATKGDMPDRFFNALQRMPK